MKNLILLLSVSIISSCVICRLEEEIIDYSIPHVLNESQKINYTFSEGSYWIYQNSSLAEDSLVLTLNENGFTDMIPDKAHPQEYLKSTFQNITQGTSFNHYYTPIAIKQNGGGDFGELGQPIFIYNNYVSNKSPGATVTDYFITLDILSTTYNAVTKMTIKADEQIQHEFDFDTDLYFAPKVGIIKKVIYDTISGTKTWELKRYHIE